MARSRFFPPDDVTAGVWLCLLERYDEAEVRERRARLALTIKRLVRKGMDPKRLHVELMRGTKSWEQHKNQRTLQAVLRKQHKLVTRAQRDVARALASLRAVYNVHEVRVHEDYAHVDPHLTRFLAGGVMLLIDDDDLLAIRDVLLKPPMIPKRPPQGGRPWDWLQITDAGLRALGVSKADRRELMSALGFVDAE